MNESINELSPQLELWRKKYVMKINSSKMPYEKSLGFDKSKYIYN